MKYLILLSTLLLISCTKYKTPLEAIENEIGIPLDKAKVVKEISSKHGKHYQFQFKDIEPDSPISDVLNGKDCKVAGYSLVQTSNEIYYIKDNKNKVIGTIMVLSAKSPVKVLIKISD